MKASDLMVAALEAELASMCRPASRKTLRIAAFGLDFIAYRTVTPERKLSRS